MKQRVRAIVYARCLGWFALCTTIVFAALARCDLVVALVPPLASADASFQAGQFDAAKMAYARIVARRPGEYAALVGLGTLALYENRLDDARTWLGRARKIKPNAIEPKVLLAECAVRHDNFSTAATLVRSLDFGASPLQGRYSGSVSARQFAGFRGLRPYSVEGVGDSLSIAFVKTDPLPLVRVSVNGARETIFLIDTGGAQVVLDPAFARELHVPEYGSFAGLFAGGKRAVVPYARIDSLKLGAWKIKNVPVQLVSVRPIAASVGVKRLDGVIGSTLLYHFLSTIDYKGGRLILRRIGSPAARRFTVASSSAKRVPFLLVGDHFEFAEGRVNALPSAQFHVDTGLGGAGVNVSDALLRAAHIRLQTNKQSAGLGGGGATTSIPYTVPLVSLGPVRRTNVPGFYDGGIAPLKQQFGFAVGSVIGHDFFRRSPSHSTSNECCSSLVRLERAATRQRCWAYKGRPAARICSESSRVRWASRAPRGKTLTSAGFSRNWSARVFDAIAVPGQPRSSRSSSWRERNLQEA